MQIGLTAADNKEHFIAHDLNFAQSRYESKHVIVRLDCFQTDSYVIYAYIFCRRSRTPRRLYWRRFVNLDLFLAMRTE
jgi:hypothetical protein